MEALAILQPLQSLPSMLALRDIRQRVLTAAEAADRRRLAIRLLELDPLSTLRVMRFARAPIIAAGEPAHATIGALVDATGSVAALRLLDVPVVDPERTRRLRTLWLHSIATACAARRLASTLGTEPAEVAYLRGLLHDLTPWLELLGLHHNGERSLLRGTDLVSAWNLPIDAATLHRSELPTDTPLAQSVAGHPEHLVTVAEALAELAGFCHPDSDGPRDRAERLARSRREDLVEAHEIAADVQTALGRFGLDRTGDDAPPRQSEADAELELFAGRSSGDSLDVVLALLASRSTESVRALRTLACSSAVRHLDVDRAFVIHVDRDEGTVWFRGKADLSRLPLNGVQFRLHARELATLDAVATDGRPRILVRSDPPEGICAAAAADRMLAAPLRVEGRMQSFVLLDRAMTGRPIDEESDGRVARALSGYVALVGERIELQLRRRRAERDATTDPLTLLTNRRAGMAQLSNAIAGAQRASRPLCVLMLDLDDFKQLNDQFGHLTGDQALRVAATVLKKTCRQSDLLCRYGGEEFLAALPDTTAEEATVLATRLFTAVADAGVRHGLPLTVSIGLTALRHGEALDELVGRADRALYASKARGRNRFSIDA